MKQKKVRRRKEKTRDIVDPLVDPYGRKFNVSTSGLRRAQQKLIQLIEQTQFEEAREMLVALVKTTKFNIANTWKVGTEVLGHCSPQLLSDYLKAVYVYSQQSLSPVTFNVYIDQLMIDKKWATAIDEIELVYHRDGFRNPLLLRKLGICTYRQWEETKDKLPPDFFEEDSVDNNEDDSESMSLLKSTYKRHLEVVKKYLPVTCRTLIRDPEILELYCNFLTFTGDEDTKKKYIRLSLKEVDKEPDYFLLFFLVKINGDNVYFKSKPYIIYLYECDPYLDAHYGLFKYVHHTCKQLKKLAKSSEDLHKDHKLVKRATKLLHLFVYRTEHNNFEPWFLERVRDIFKYAPCPEMSEYWKSKNVEKLISFYKNKEK